VPIFEFSTNFALIFLRKGKELISVTGFLVFVRASSVGFATEMHELQFAFSLADVKAGQALPDLDLDFPDFDFWKCPYSLTSCMLFL
jgi:hypothetical protein